MIAAQSPQLLADRHADAPADALIDLVEDQRRRLVGARQHVLEREHQPGRLTARRDLRPRLQSFADIPRNEKLRLFQPPRLAPRTASPPAPPTPPPPAASHFISTAKRAPDMRRSFSSASMPADSLSAAACRASDKCLPSSPKIGR